MLQAHALASRGELASVCIEPVGQATWFLLTVEEACKDVDETTIRQYAIEPDTNLHMSGVWTTEISCSLATTPRMTYEHTYTWQSHQQAASFNCSTLTRNVLETSNRSTTCDFVRFPRRNISLWGIGRHNHLSRVRFAGLSDRDPTEQNRIRNCRLRAWEKKQLLAASWNTVIIRFAMHISHVFFLRKTS
jgi:hypothetical protein